MNTPTRAQKITANEVLRAYVKQDATFSCELYQDKEFIFKAHLPHGSTIFVIVGTRGAIKDSGWL